MFALTDSIKKSNFEVFFVHLISQMKSMQPYQVKIIHNVHMEESLFPSGSCLKRQFVFRELGYV